MGVGVAFLVLAGLLGASVGSFLNVVIYRLPAGASIVRPASRCPACKAQLKAWHNIPILGWFLVRGRCASCQTPISVRYPLVELAMAVLAVALLADIVGGVPTPERLAGIDPVMDLIGPFLLYLAFVAALVAVTFIDLDHFIIPDGISLGGIPFGIATAWIFGEAVGVTWQDAAIGALAGGGVIAALILGYGALTGRQGMGGGDWKLLALIGAWLGWLPLPFILMAASFQGLLFAAVFRRSFTVTELPPDPRDGGEAVPLGPAEGGGGLSTLAVPFGPFLALGALEYLYFRGEIRALLDAWLGV